MKIGDIEAYLQMGIALFLGWSMRVEAALATFGIGAFFGTILLIISLSIDKDRKETRLFLLAAAGALLTGCYGLWFGLPLLAEFFGYKVTISISHLWWHVLGTVAGVIAALAAARWIQPWINKQAAAKSRRSELERNQRTDVRTIQEHMPRADKAYDATRFLPRDPKKEGVLVGLGGQKGNDPVRVDYEKFRTSHVQVVGTTGTGKGVASTLLLVQALRAGEAVVVVDPKSDEWAPHVLKEEAERLDVPFRYIDLREDQPQIDFFADLNSEQAEELLISGFALAERGEAADFYRVSDRKAAFKMASIIGRHHTFTSLLKSDEGADTAKWAAGFHSKLEEISRVKALQAPGGLRLSDVLEGGCTYIVGSFRNSRIITAQRMLFTRLIQIAEARDRITSRPRQICVFLDEFRYHISRPALEGLATVRDKGMHIVLAHQSIDDLRDAPADLDGDSVVGAVIENCSMRVAYRVQSPDTAEWLARMSGEILVDDETRKIKRNVALSEHVDPDRTVRQAVRNLIDTNMFLNLPPRVAVAFTGIALPQFAHICPVKVEKKALSIVPYDPPTPDTEPSVFDDGPPHDFAFDETEISRSKDEDEPRYFQL